MMAVIYFNVKQIKHTFLFLTVGILSLKIENYFVIIPVKFALVFRGDEFANPVSESEISNFSLTQSLKNPE